MSTFTGLHYHLVFSTKNRIPLLSRKWSAQLHEYLGGTVRGLEGAPLGVGGVADHVHLLVTLKATHTLSDFMRELKKSTSTWIKEKQRLDKFNWQDGYAAFTVSPSARRRVREYIANQAEHHRARSFREELETLLRKSEIPFEERYLD